MAHWIPTGNKNEYRCSNCGKTITTANPIDYWTFCPFCHAEMSFEEAADGDTDTEKNT